jgi:hypothetical protein
MRYRVLAALPLAWGAIFLLIAFALMGHPLQGAFLRIEITLVKLLAVAGAWSAAQLLERGEYPRRGWFLVGAGIAIFLVRDLVAQVPRVPEAVGLGPAGQAVLRAVLVSLGNLVQLVGIWLLSRAWKVASLALPVSPRGQAATVAGAVALALAFAGPGIVTDARRILGGELERVAGLASALGDFGSLCLIAPLLLTALALRGGLLGWPFLLLTVSCVAWLFYDATLVLGGVAGLAPAQVRVWSELFRALGCTFLGAAGLAQRFVVSQMRALGRPAAAS